MVRPVSILSWIILLVAGVLTISAIVKMMGVRFSTGQTYPPYSSHRAEPDGTRVLFEALDRLPGVECERNYQPIKRLKASEGDVLIMADLRAGKVQEHCGCVEDGKTISSWASAGGRVILALKTGAVDGGFQSDKPKRVRKSKSKSKEEKEEDKPDEEAPEKPVKKEPLDDRIHYLGCAFGLFVRELSFQIGSDSLPPKPTPSTHLPLKRDDLPHWFSNSYLEPAPDVEGQWITLASKGTRPVMMERKIGKGSLVVCTDSFFLSNESLWLESNPALLAHLVGNTRRVVFEERAHGVGDDDGIMTLARRYGMHGLFIGGIVLFALFVWRNAVSLVPMDESADLGHWRGDSVAGQGAASGLVSILKRGIKPKDLLDKCFADWEITRGATTRIPHERIAAAREIVSAQKQSKHPLRQIQTTYRRLCEALHPTKL
jgi:hypothetical protein